MRWNFIWEFLLWAVFDTQEVIPDDSYGSFPRGSTRVGSELYSVTEPSQFRHNQLTAEFSRGLLEIAVEQARQGRGLEASQEMGQDTGLTLEVDQGCCKLRA